jgi:hypothetical protein
MSAEIVLQVREIEVGLGRYARACDQRDWAGFDAVFAPDAIADYGEFQVQGREAIVASIRAHLGACGPSQHMLGNFVIATSGKSADSRCYVRAFHRGAGEKAHLLYEVFGEYDAHWRRLPEGWRVMEWIMRVICETGSREILGPG